MEGEFGKEQAGGWGDLNGVMIDIIAKHSKLSGRWSRDGRSLRSLNRHWRDIITLHVTHLHPLPDRVIEDEDLDSLENFSEATSVDFTAFLFQNRETVKKFHRHPKEPSTARFLKLLERLRRLPKLQQLKAKWNWYTKARLKSNGEVEAVKNAMAKLTGVSRLEVDSDSNYPNKEDLSIFSPLPIQEVSGWIVLSDWAGSLDLFPSPRKAWISTGRPFKYLAPLYLTHLEALQSWTSDRKDCEYLPDERAVEELKIEIMHRGGVDSILELTHLKDLSLRCFCRVSSVMLPDTSRFIHGDIFSAIQTLHRLENLELNTSCCYAIPQEMWNSLFEGMSSLKSLSLSHVRCDGAAILKHLQNLEILKLLDCDLLDSEKFFSFADLQGSLECKTLQRIRELEVVDQQIYRDQPLVYHWSFLGLSKMSRLESFTYSSYAREFPIEHLREPALCRTLRRLEIGTPVAWNSTGRDVLLSLSHLEVIKLGFKTLELCDMEDIERTLAELRAENPWISLQLSAPPLIFYSWQVRELQELLKTAGDFLHKAKGVTSNLLSAEFKPYIEIFSREELSALSEVAEEFSLLKNSPEWMDIRTKISIHENFSSDEDACGEVETIFNKIKNSCPRGSVSIDGLTGEYSWNPHDLYC